MYPIVPVTARGTLKPVQNTVPIQSLSELKDGVYVIERGRGCELQSKRTGVCLKFEHVQDHANQYNIIFAWKPKTYS